MAVCRGLPRLTKLNFVKTLNVRSSFDNESFKKIIGVITLINILESWKFLWVTNTDFDWLKVATWKS